MSDAAARLDSPRRKDGCIFCKIVDGEAAARFEHIVDDEGNLVSHDRIVVFHNQLDWARVMLLVVPRDHMTQAEYWTTDIFREVAQVATMIGERLCPEGYRVLSNFGRPAHQSQEHAHLHIVSAPDMDLPSSFDGSARLFAEQGDVRVTETAVPGVPLAARVTRAGAATQTQLWSHEKFVECGKTAVRFASEETPEGFRLISNFYSAAAGYSGGGDAGLVLLGGGQLDLYA